MDVQSNEMATRRQRPSTSRNRTDGPDLEAMVDALASIFDCTVCWERVIPPIFQCAAGHILCARCKNRTNRCPSCRGVLGQDRNLALERVAEILGFPCKYRNWGCRRIVRNTERRTHERSCAFRTCPCPVLDPKCWWEGICRDIPTHLSERHPDIGGGDLPVLTMFLVGWHLPRKCSWVAQLAWGNHRFLGQAIKEESEEGRSYHFIYLLLRYLGPKGEARRFRGRIELAGRNQTYTFEDTPRWVVGDLPSIMQHGDCMIVISWVAEALADDQALSVTMSVQPIDGEEWNIPGRPRGEEENDSVEETSDADDAQSTESGSPAQLPHREEEPLGNGGDLAETNLEWGRTGCLKRIIRRAASLRARGQPTSVLLPVGEPIPEEVRAELRALNLFGTRRGGRDPGYRHQSLEPPRTQSEERNLQSSLGMGRGLHLSGSQRTVGAALRDIRQNQVPNSTSL
ncbi:E3 ubiquitin-protein ligase SIAH1-like isoform X2 [Centruroides sculpturatus]|uniref:E3 ubiquitin-protein ligase SIAH1-like isoform X2 n=1 Tax=Centruroides sculpturatus TaxID=218467 RepID=UPI000C6E1BE0|nr:E3 ubiquitin-protein ligase SIAH1-like isoform X2 [Centruroides sculpturatus]